MLEAAVMWRSSVARLTAGCDEIVRGDPAVAAIAVGEGVDGYQAVVGAHGELVGLVRPVS